LCAAPYRAEGDQDTGGDIVVGPENLLAHLGRYRGDALSRSAA
jgi:hypothetical protein